MDATMTWPHALRFSLTFVTGQAFGALAAMLLASVGVAQEYRWGTFALTLRQGVSRPAALGAKVVTMLGGVTLLVLTALLTGGLFSAIFTLIQQGGLPASRIDWLQLVLSVLRSVYTLLPYLALACLFAVLTRSIAWSLGAGVAYALVIEGPLTQVLMYVIGGLPAKLVRWLPGPLALAVVDVNSTLAVGGTPVTGGPQLLPPEVAAAGIAVYTLVFLTLAFVVFARQDIAG
jgi:ABC-type transport system involved in multi-copper enzyme maturation permease subunit